MIADNPRLTVRLVEGRSPRRVVLDSTLRLPLDCHLLTDRAVPTQVVTTRRASEERMRAVRDLGVDVLCVAEDGCGHVDLRVVLQELHTESLLIEGGGSVITSALRQRLVNRLVVCIAPKVIGSGIDAVGDIDVLRLRDALSFARAHFTPLEDDVIFDGDLE